MSRKHELGQFMTTNFDYILTDMKIPDNVVNIIEPFCGNGDLLRFIPDKSRFVIECFDIEASHDFIVERDTIMNPPCYENKFVITNPPYLARNKSSSKISFDKYDVNDLYKCFIKEIISNTCMGGILIIPLNFWSSIRVSDITLRKMFLNIYNIIKINIFEERVFEDTSYTVCAFQFEKRNTEALLLPSSNVHITIYPSKKIIDATLCLENNYLVGGYVYNLPMHPTYKISRLTSKNISSQNTSILVKCIDDNKNSRIGLSLVSPEEIYVDNTPNQTARTYATLVITPPLDVETQKKLVCKFNAFLNEQRILYHSLFLANYRESKDIARKRISFDLVYRMVSHLLM
jgi:hypothetical protein